MLFSTRPLPPLQIHVQTGDTDHVQTGCSYRLCSVFKEKSLGLNIPSCNNSHNLALTDLPSRSFAPKLLYSITNLTMEEVLDIMSSVWPTPPKLSTIPPHRQPWALSRLTVKIYNFPLNRPCSWCFWWTSLKFCTKFSSEVF